MNIQQLDYLKGTGILTTHRKKLAPEFYVFISVGGIGLKALAQIKRTIDANAEGDYKNQVVFLAVDTSWRDLDEYIEAGIFNENEVLRLPYRGALNSIKPENLIQSPMRTWVHDRLYEKTNDGKSFDGSGASATRQCGRVLISQPAAQRLIYSKLENIYEGLVRYGQAPSKVQVFFFAGIAGGTGSGCTLDLAFLTRHFLGDILGDGYNDRLKLSAYIFLPSACSNRPPKPEDVKNGNRNAYAALKEIDHYMTLTNRQEHFVMDYGTDLSNNIDIDRNVFDFCSLVEGIADNGVFSSDNAETARQIVAESVMNIICVNTARDGVTDIINQPIFLVDSFHSNDSTQIETHVGQQEDRIWPYDTNYTYSVIGFSSCVVPIDLLTVYVVKKIFDEVFRKFQAAGDASADLAADFLEQCGLSSRRMAGFVRNEQLWSTIQATADEWFKARGPFFMVNLTLEAVKLIENTPDEYLLKAQSMAQKAIVGRAKWNKMVNIYKETAKYLEKINKNLYEVYTCVVKELQKIIEDNAKLLTDANEYETQFGKSFRWSPIDLTPGNQATKAVIEYLDDMLNQKEVRDNAKKFMDHLCEKRDEWTQIIAPEGSGLAKFDAAKIIREFIAEHLQKCINTSFEGFVVKAYSGNPDASPKARDTDGQEICSDDTKNAARKITEILERKASPLASTTDDFALSACYKNVYYTVPSNCQWLYKAIKEISGNNEVNQVFKSSAHDRVVLCHLYSGVPAWALNWTPRAEETYEKNPQYIGLHIDQRGKETDWISLPNLYPEKKWTAVQRIQREREASISQRIREAMGKAKSLHMLYDHIENDQITDYMDVLLLLKDMSADDLFRAVLLDSRKKYSIEEILRTLIDENLLTPFQISYTGQVMTPTNRGSMTSEQRNDIRFDMACRTIRRRHNERLLLEKTVPVIEELKKRIDERVVMDSSCLMLFINCLRWNLVTYDGRRSIWKYYMESETSFGNVLESKINKCCAHYHGFAAFAALPDNIRSELQKNIDELRATASNKQFDETNLHMNELKSALDALKTATLKNVDPWPIDDNAQLSVFKDSNASPWPMSSLDFEEEVGIEKAKEIRSFYQDLINNL